MDRFIRMLPEFALAALITLILTPLVKRIGFKFGIYAKENDRTVHHGKIARIGGLGIFLAFNIVCLTCIPLNTNLKMIIIGGIVVFLGGFLDDIFDLKPLIKLAFIIVGALIPIIFDDVGLRVVNIFGYCVNIHAFSTLLSFIWIIGVTNAINLIDGLDGLATGISFFVLLTFGLIGMFSGHYYTASLVFILAGALIGFLPYNFNPASIFLGDCGALYIGYMIASLSLLGFKTSTFISLGFPIIILFIPLEDTILAIVRRKVKGQKITHADKSHLHHVLMYKIGLSHRDTVLVLYLVTIMFSITAIVMFFNVAAGLTLMIMMCIGIWIFIELTGMISPKFHPIIALCRRVFGHPIKKNDAFFEANRIKHREN